MSSVASGRSGPGISSPVIATLIVGWSPLSSLIPTTITDARCARPCTKPITRSVAGRLAATPSRGICHADERKALMLFPSTWSTYPLHMWLRTLFALSLVACVDAEVGDDTELATDDSAALASDAKLDAAGWIDAATLHSDTSLQDFATAGTRHVHSIWVAGTNNNR